MPESGSSRRQFREQPSEELRLRAIVEHVADGIVIVDKNGFIRFVNPAAAGLFGRSAEELLNQSFGFPVVAHDIVEIEILPRGGSPVVAEQRVTEMRWEGQRSYLVSLRDITERREAEERNRQLQVEQLARSRAEAEQQRLRFLAQATRILDSSLRVDTLLHRFARFLVTRAGTASIEEPPGGMSAKLADLCIIDLIEDDGSLRRVSVAYDDRALDPLVDRLHQEFAPEPNSPYLSLEAIRTGEPTLYPEISDELLTRATRDPEHADILRQLQIDTALVVPLIDRGRTLGAMLLCARSRRYGEQELALARDLGHRAALSLANARLYEQAQSANRAKGDFLGVMSHELRTPLNAIIGYADLMAAEVPGPITPAQSQYLRRIVGSSSHLLEIIEEILAYTRAESGVEEMHPAELDLAQLLRDVGEMIRPLAERKGLAFELLVTDGTETTVSDARKLRQIVLNLLSNAVKFTDDGFVRLELESRAPDGWVIRVADSGCGIPQEHLERIFEPFWQVEQSTRRTVQGTGLGLSVTRRLGELIGGELSVESEVGVGSTFTFRLPTFIAPAVPQPASSPFEAEPTPPGRLQAEDPDRHSGRGREHDNTDSEHP
ncbi:MAG: ATP-binding protein [Gemmatimonadota bacterium]